MIERKDIPKPMTPPEVTAQRLAEFAGILSEYGPGSQEAADYMDKNRSDDKFVKLARLSIVLKQALTVGVEMPCD